MFRIPSLCIAAIVTACTIVPACSAEEEKLTLDQLPAAVKTTMQKEANGATLSDLEKETKKGKVVYTAEIPGAKKGEVIELMVAEDGTLLGKKTEEDDDHDGGEHQDGEHEGHEHK